MEILFLLYLAHFLGDYPFQTNWIYAQKLKSWKGALFHAGGVLCALLICLAPFLHSAIIWQTLGVIVVTHYFQDIGKVALEKKCHSRIYPYLADQLFHLLLSGGLWYIWLKEVSFSPAFGEIFYKNVAAIAFLIGLILVTYTCEVTRFILSGQANYQPQGTQMWKNAVIYGILWGGGILISLL